MNDIMNGIQTYRNPRLVHVFDKLGMIENFGTGIPRTIDSYSKYNVKPEFKATENFFIVTLPNLNHISNDSINDLGLEILRCLKEFQGLNTLQIVKKISHEDPNITRDKVKNELKRYLTNYVEHRGSNRNGGYHLKDLHINKQDKVE